MEEWPCGKREELVVGIDEEFGEVVPPTFGVQFLSLSASRVMTARVCCLPYTPAPVYPADRQVAPQLC